MSVSPIQPMWMQGGGGAQSLLQQTMSAAAKALNLSATTLMGDLRSGQSLAQIAQAQGMNANDLVNSIVSALQQSGGTYGGLSTSQLTQMVTSMVNATPIHGHSSIGADGQSSTGASGGPLLLVNGGGSATWSPSPSLFQDTMGAAAQTLGLNTQTLLNDLGSGQSLAQIAQAQGVNVNDLVNSIVSALQSSGGSPASAAGSNLTQMVTDLVNAVPGQSSGAGGPFLLNVQG